MTRSRGRGGGIPPIIWQGGLAILAILVVGAVFFPQYIPGYETGEVADTTTGGGIQQTFDNSNDVDIDVSVTDCAKPATAFSAADTIWLIKDAASGVWTYKETDANSASPSLTTSPGVEYKALIYDDGTGYGKIITGTAPYQAETTTAVCLDTIDTTPTLSFFRHDDGVKMTSSAPEPITSANQTFDLIQYRVAVDDYTAFNSPVLCFDYNYTNFSDVYVRGASTAAIPKFLLGTVEGCYDIPAPSPGTPTTGYVYVKTLDVGAATNLSINTYLVDKQWYQNTKTGDFELGTNINDVTTNVGDSTDSTKDTVMYFQRA